MYPDISANKNIPEISGILPILFFQLFLYDEQNPVKTYAEIEMFVFHTITNDTKKIRNLMTRLRVKLGCDLFDTLHGYGHSLKHKKD